MNTPQIIKDERKGLKELDITCQINSTEDYTEAYERLKNEELRLIEQKEKLTNLTKQLETKAKEKLEKKQQNVENLTLEVETLKKKCEKYANIINSQEDAV